MQHFAQVFLSSIFEFPYHFEFDLVRAHNFETNLILFDNIVRFPDIGVCCYLGESWICFSVHKSLVPTVQISFKMTTFFGGIDSVNLIFLWDD